MADQTTPPPTGQTGSTLTVPPDLQAKHPELIQLIRASESMNDEERQYWVNILPIMTPEQIQNLREILENERKQLAAIDAKYQTEMNRIGQAEVVRQTDEQRKQRRTERTSKEASHKEQEEAVAEDLLKKIGEA